jgi:hypothetical protein
MLAENSWDGFCHTPSIGWGVKSADGVERVIDAASYGDATYDLPTEVVGYIVLRWCC